MRQDYNEVRARIKTMMAEQGATMNDVAALLNEKYPDSRSPVKPMDITNKLQRQTLRLSESIKIADVLGYEVVFRKKEPDLDPAVKERALAYAIKLLEAETK